MCFVVEAGVGVVLVIVVNVGTVALALNIIPGSSFLGIGRWGVGAAAVCWNGAGGSMTAVALGVRDGALFRASSQCSFALGRVILGRLLEGVGVTSA